jgi:predicted MFS family arabinose efflux permease
MLSVLRQRNFALLWWGGTLSRTGTFMLYAALPYFVYATSGSVTASGLAFMSEVVPSILFNTVGGVFADRLPRKAVMALGNISRGVLILPLLAVHDTSTLWIVYVCGFLNSTIASLAGPFGSAALPHIVSAEDLPAANGARSAGENVASLIGAPLGGILLQHVGLGPVVVIDVISFIIPTVTIFMIDVPLEEPGEGRVGIAGRSGAYEEWLAGWRYVAATPAVARLFLVALAMTLGSGMLGVVFVAFVRRILDGSPEFFSWALALSAVSSIAGGLVIGRMSSRVGPGGLISGSLIVAGVLTLIEVGAARQPITLAVALLIGAPILWIDAGISTLLQAGVRRDLRGRMYGHYISAANVAGLTGNMIATFLTDEVGIRLMIAVAGAILTLAGMVAVRLLPWRPAGAQDFGAWTGGGGEMELPSH